MDHAIQSSEAEWADWASVAAVTINDSSPTIPTGVIEDSSASESTSESEPGETWKAYQERRESDDEDPEIEFGGDALHLNDLFPGASVQGFEEEDFALPSVEGAKEQLEQILMRKDRIQAISSKYFVASKAAADGQAKIHEVLGRQPAKLMELSAAKKTSIDISAPNEGLPDLQNLSVARKDTTGSLDSRALTYLAEQSQQTLSSDSLELDSCGKVLEQDASCEKIEPLAERPVHGPEPVKKEATASRPVFGPPARPGKKEVADVLGQLRHGLRQLRAGDSEVERKATSSEPTKAALKPEEAQVSDASVMSSPSKETSLGSLAQVAEAKRPPAEKPGQQSKKDEQSASEQKLACSQDGTPGAEEMGLQPVDAEKFRAGLASDALKREELWQQFLACNDSPVGGDMLPSPEDFYRRRAAE
mmetsp:Transcript_85077/g.150437  ORF Transcript_85077/g.150437 Transcript_85077/m.150437 type:complete len:419 (-) Transcript_85077:66-1322(-)